MVDELRIEGYEDLSLVSVNAFISAAGMDSYVNNVDGPCLQDTDGDPVHTLLGASAYDIYVVDRAGCRRYESGYGEFPDNSGVLAEAVRYLNEEPL